jgi:membrane protein DedA with SNARE-associated domain
VELLLIKYGTLAVFLAAMLEADVVPVLTGVVAHFGYVRVGPAVLAAMAGAFAGDYVWFCVGVYYSKTIRNSRFYRRAGQVPERLIRRSGLWQIPASHLIYGTRISTMMFWGVQRISTLKFALVDVSGCFVLTGLLFTLGFALSASAPLVVERVKQVELLLLGVVISGLLLCLTSKLVRRFLLEVPTGEPGREGR